tara:strand:+ start:1283 stop:1960 length:678 start_codon:yes stop_codon:yes gene_type:complete
MTFLNQVQGLTGLTISASDTSPTRDELSQFLRDGLIDVINRMIQVKPEETPKFTTTTEDANNSGVTVQGKIISVVREHDSTSTLRSCTPISPQDRYEATDTDSLKYRSKYNPGYFALDGKIYTRPISAGSNNSSLVTQVSYDTGLTHDDSESGVENFPDEYAYLIALYAGIKSLEAKMAEYTITEEDYELATSMKLSIDNLRRQYDMAFMPGASEGQAQPQQGER